MFNSYLKIAIRNLLRHKGYSFVNLAGLVVGMACFILIMLYVQDELSYDKYHEKKDRIYRLVTRMEGASFEALAKVAGPWGPAAREGIPEVENFVRFVFFGTSLVSRGEKRFYESDGLYADSTVFEVFSYSLLRGDPQTALSRPNSIVLTEDMATRYFGSDNPLGQTLTFDNRYEYAVTGVMKNVPGNSHFTFSFLASLATSESPYWNDFARVKDQWLFFQAYTYLLLRDGAAPQLVEPKLANMLGTHLDEESAAKYTPFLQRLTDIHLYSHLWREMASNSEVSRLYIFSAIAFFILLIACINYMNLASVRSVSRAKEVGMRKVAGAEKGMLVRQLLGESVFLSMVALALAIGCAEIALRSFNPLVGKNLAINFFKNGLLLPGLIGLSLLAGLISGSYPALILSSFKPAQVLKGGIKPSGKAILRKGLVMFQFAASTLLLIATGIVYNQTKFIQGKNLGFNKDQLLIAPIRDDAMQRDYERVKNELMQYPGVIGVSASANHPGGSDWSAVYRAYDISEGQQPPARLLVVDHDFIKTYGIEMALGRDFSETFATDAGGAVIINEEAAKQLGWENPLGRKIYLNWFQHDAQIIGVAKDFHFRSLHEVIGPLMLYVSPRAFDQLTIRIRPENMEETLAFLEKKWAEFDPDHPLTYTFFDEQFGELHQSEQQMFEVLTSFAALAIFIACLGLLGLVAYAAEQRTKEIGIRKVLGASVSGIVALLSKDFVKIVLIANLIAWPAGWYVMNKWLQNFAYRIDIGWWVFALAGGLALLIALLTVSTQAIKAALANPVEALRYE